MTTTQPRQTLRNRFGFGIGTIGRDAGYTLISMFLLFYLSDILSVSTPVFASVTVILVAVRVFDAVIDPFVGVLVDNTRSKWGKFKPWIFVGVVISALLVGWISDRVQRRKMFVMWGALGQSLAAFTLVFVSDYTVTFIAAIFLGLGYGVYLAAGQALATQLLPDVKSRAKDLGIMNVAYQAPIALAPWLGAVIVITFIGFSGLFLVSGTLAALGAIIILAVRAR